MNVQLCEDLPTARFLTTWFGQLDPVAGTLRTAERPAPRHLEVLRVDGVDYVDLGLLARLFHGTKYWRAELEKMRPWRMALL